MAGLNRRVALAAIVLPVLFLAMSAMASAATFTVINPAELSLAITIANTNSPPNTINFAANITLLTSALPAIASGNNLTINGNGFTLDGDSKFQILSVNPGATLKLQNLTIAHGNSQSIPQGEHGGGVENEGTLTVTNCTFSNNTAGLGGGAIDNVGTLTVTNSTFSSNSADAAGGGIDNFGPLTVTDCTFSSNSADQGGGILNNDGATLKITNSTFSGNSAGIGGGIDNVGTLTVTNNTFSGNSAGIGGGGIDNQPLGSTTLKGTILAAEPGGNCGGLITDAGYNISDDVSCGFTGTSVDEIALNLDPAGLQNNGGPTKTIALKSNSEAVDFIPVADCTDQSSPTPQPLITDQRGLPRPDPGNPDFCDAGAFELQTTPFVLVPNSERVQIARSTTPDSDQINMAFTFTENGFPACDAADDAFDGFFVVIESGTCAVHDDASLLFFLQPWVVHTVNHQSYGTIFQSMPPETVSARMVELPTPVAPACGEWTLNLEIAGIDSTPLGNGPFSLILSNPHGDQECFDITNAIVGSQIPTPSHSVRRGVRR